MWAMADGQPRASDMPPPEEACQPLPPVRLTRRDIRGWEAWGGARGGRQHIGLRAVRRLRVGGSAAGGLATNRRRGAPSHTSTALTNSATKAHRG